MFIIKVKLMRNVPINGKNQHSGSVFPRNGTKKRATARTRMVMIYELQFSDYV